MKIIHDAHTLVVREIEALTAANSEAFRSALLEALASPLKQIELHFSATSLMDCGGVGALVGLRNSARKQNQAVTIHLLNPSAPTRHLLHLTRLEETFPVKRP